MSQPVCWVLLPVQRLERDFPFFPAAVLRLVVARLRRGGCGRPCRLRGGAPRLVAALARAAVLSALKVLEVFHHEDVLGPLLPGLLVVPLLQDQVPFEEHLMA